MMYEVSRTHFFRENGRKLEPGETIELTAEEAAAHLQNEPGLLKPCRVNAQAHADEARQEDEAVTEGEEKPKRRKRVRE